MFEALTTYMTAKNQKAPQKAADVSVSAAQRDAMQANMDNMPMIEALLSRGNQFNQAQNNSLLEQAVGGYGDWSKQMGKNATAYANGTMSSEQLQNLTRMSAERGISTGRGGQAGNFSLLRDLGIDQYQSGQMSQNIMQSLIGMAKVNPMSPLSMMATTQDALGVAESNRSAQQAWLNADQASKNVRSNAFWSGLAAGDATFQQASGMGGGGMGNSMGGMGKQTGQSSNDKGSANYADHGMGGGGVGYGYGGGGAGDTSSFSGGWTDMASGAGSMSGAA